MNRRRLLGWLGAGAACAFGRANPASAELACGPFNLQGVQVCDSGIDSTVAGVTAAGVGGQHLSQWCWAACIEIVFRYHGYRIPQERIVQETWGAIVNFPGQPMQILADLNREWRDSRGRNFRVYGDSASANPVTAAQDLSQNMPLIIGTMAHAMVLTAVRYARNAWGAGEVIAATVRDPWPGRGRRVLAPIEWYSTNFLVRIRVEPLD